MSEVLFLLVLSADRNFLMESGDMRIHCSHTHTHTHTHIHTHTHRPPTVVASHPGDVHFPASPVCVITSKKNVIAEEKISSDLLYITAVVIPRLDVDSAY